MSCFRSNKFTLIEMLIVIAIVVILFSMIIGCFKGCGSESTPDKFKPGDVVKHKTLNKTYVILRPKGEHPNRSLIGSSDTYDCRAPDGEIYMLTESELQKE